MSFADRVNGEEFLQQHYHYFTRYIQPQDFFSWLRSKKVFSESDQEEVEKKYITTYLKAGQFVNIILYSVLIV